MWHVLVEGVRLWFPRLDPHAATRMFAGRDLQVSHHDSSKRPKTLKPRGGHGHRGPRLLRVSTRGGRGVGGFALAERPRVAEVRGGRRTSYMKHGKEVVVIAALEAHHLPHRRIQTPCTSHSEGPSQPNKPKPPVCRTAQELSSEHALVLEDAGGRRVFLWIGAAAGVQLRGCALEAASFLAQVSMRHKRGSLVDWGGGPLAVVLGCGVTWVDRPWPMCGYAAA
jgi:hypothetical protein